MALSLITASRAGVSVDSLREMVSGCDYVLGWRGLPGSVFFLSEPRTRVCPPPLLTLLRGDMGGLLAEVSRNGVSVLRWHDVSLASRAYLRYLAPLLDPAAAAECEADELPLPQSVMATLAEYFSGELALRFPTRSISGNWLAFKASDAAFWRSRDPGDVGLVRQCMSELPYYLVRAGDGYFDRAVELLCDIHFFEAASALEVAGDLMAQLGILRAGAPKGADVKRLADLDDFLAWGASHLWALLKARAPSATACLSLPRPSSRLVPHVWPCLSAALPLY